MALLYVTNVPVDLNLARKIRLEYILNPVIYLLIPPIEQINILTVWKLGDSGD